MSDKDNDLPVGDASHLLDNEPKPHVARSLSVLAMRVKLSQP